MVQDPQSVRVRDAHFVVHVITPKAAELYDSILLVGAKEELVASKSHVS